MSIKQIAPDELKIKLDNGEDVIFIDCRERDEFEEGHIPQAQFIPLSHFEKEIENIMNKNIEIVVACRSGHRSMNACEILDSKGFTNISNLSGGILGWIEDGLEIIRE
ncbi:MAG: rhodanese-like domain-containing protein [Bdellovibrionota bacterium]